MHASEAYIPPQNVQFIIDGDIIVELMCFRSLHNTGECTVNYTTDAPRLDIMSDEQAFINNGVFWSFTSITPFGFKSPISANYDVSH
jgi:hypothetical protein